MSFKEIKPEELRKNPFQMIGKEWLLVTAKKDGNHPADSENDLRLLFFS